MKVRTNEWKCYGDTNGSLVSYGYKDEEYVDIESANITNICAFPHGTVAYATYNKNVHIASRICIACDFKYKFTPTSVNSHYFEGDIEHNTTTPISANYGTSIDGTSYSFQRVIGVLASNGMKQTGGRWPLISDPITPYDRYCGHINIYFFGTALEAYEYLHAGNNEAKDNYAREHAWNYEEIQSIVEPLKTTFTVYRNNTWKPKTTIKWSSPKIGKGKKYEPTDVTVIIRAWSCVHNQGNIYIPPLPVTNEEEPNPLPENAVVLYTGKFENESYAIQYDKLLKIFTTLIKTRKMGYVFDMYVKAHDGNESRHCFCYFTNKSAINYNKVDLSAWHTGYFHTTTDDTTIAVLGEGDGESDEGYDDPSDDIDPTDPPVPYGCIGALNTSYAMSVSRTNLFGQYLWTAGLFTNIKLMNNSPIENVLACKYYPMGFSGTDEKIKLGNVETDVLGAKIATGSTYTYDIGSITVPQKYGSFLDYEPYTSVNIFLPFIGFQSLPTSMIMGKTLNVQYGLDIISGVCKAMIFVDGIEILSFSGQMGIDIPISAQNRGQIELGYISNMATTALAVGATVASGGATGWALASQIGGGLLASANSQYRTSTSGSYSPATSACETLQVYLIIDRPIWQDLNGFNHAYGRMCCLTKRIGSLTGFTVVNQNVDLSGIECLDEEKEEIKSLLTGGIFI